MQSSETDTSHYYITVMNVSCEGLDRIYQVLAINDANQEALLNAGVATYVDLCCVKDWLIKRRIKGVNLTVQKQLVIAIEFLEQIRQGYGDGCHAIRDQFTEVQFEAFEEGRGSFLNFENVPMQSIFDLLKIGGPGCIWDKMPLEYRTRVIEWSTQEKVIEPMPEGLNKACGKFDYERFAEKAIRALFDPSTNGKTVLVAGKTQSGKSAVKAVMQSLCFELDDPLIIITKGVSESRELHKKLKEFAAGSNSEHYIVSASSSKNGGRVNWNVKKEEIQAALNDGGTLVLADTHAQIKKAVDAIKRYREKDGHRRFVVIIDEADAMHRTPERSQLMECAYDQLMALNPSLKILISATLVPVLLILNEKGEKDIEMVAIEPSDDYIGIEQMKHLKAANGDTVLLEHSDLSYNNGYIFREGAHEIPYTNKAVKMLYDDALTNDNQQKKGILVLDCTDSRVTAGGNVYEKARLVQDMYHAEGKEIVIVVYVGKGLSRRCAGGGAWEEFDSGVLVGEVLESIDDEYGLDMPVFVFGFSKMRRGISFRSNRRVPTHFVMILGMGNSNESVMQTLGRATFRGKEALKKNGLDHVTILMPKTDFVMSVAYQRFILEIQARINKGESLDNAMSGATSKLPDAANFKRHSPRKVGQWPRKQLNDLVSHDAFEEADEVAPGEADKIAKYWENATAQRVLRSLRRLTRSREHMSFATMDIAEAYNDQFRGSFSINKTELNKVLRNFSRDGLVEDERKKLQKGVGQWLVPKRNVILNYINSDPTDCTSNVRNSKSSSTSAGGERKGRRDTPPSSAESDHGRKKPSSKEYKKRKAPFFSDSN
jgi:hypothetical protein